MAKRVRKAALALLDSERAQAVELQVQLAAKDVPLKSASSNCMRVARIFYQRLAWELPLGTQKYCRTSFRPAFCDAQIHTNTGTDDINLHFIGVVVI